MRINKIAHLVLFLLLNTISINLFSQHQLSISAKSLTGTTSYIHFKGVFVISDKFDFDDFIIFQIKAIDSIQMDSSITFIFGDKADDVKKYTFSLINCKEHNNNSLTNAKQGDSLSLNVHTPFGFWYDYGCDSDNNVMNTLRLACGCKIIIPVSIIKTQLLFLNQ